MGWRYAKVTSFTTQFTLYGMIFEKKIVRDVYSSNRIFNNANKVRNVIITRSNISGTTRNEQLR